MVPVDEAIGIIMEHTTVLPSVELPLKDRVLVFGCSEILGNVLAENINAEHPLPPFPASIKDGYAVIG